MKTDHSFEQLNEVIQKYLPESDVGLIDTAYHFAKKAHEHQRRKSNEPYIVHPLEVAYILAELEQDAPTICAGLLHDTLEDCEVKPDDIARLFGSDVLRLVEGVTKLGKIYFDSSEDEQAENVRKMFLAMAQDIRVVIIKLADRLHNMRTLKFLSKERQLSISRETREIFSPLAHRLGMWSLKWELEDYAFYHLQPDDFQQIKQLVSTRREQREQYVNQLIQQLNMVLKPTGIEFRVFGRPKHFYSIYKKLTIQNLAYDELYDTLGIRVLVHSIRECYETLGVIHSEFKPLAGRFKDYIAMPKSNLYQSLHTTVMGPEGKPVEIQIRTHDMHQIAEYGIAAHWRYKEGGTPHYFDANFAWIRQLVESEKEGFRSSDFLQNLKLDLVIDEVFVFTPKGLVQVLPKGSTPLDFAYKIHTEIGHRYIGAKINSQIVSLTTPLQNGDRVEILTQKHPQPKIDWLTVVVTRQAKTKIKQWFKRAHQQEAIQLGKDKIEKSMLLMGWVAKDAWSQLGVDTLLSEFKVSKLDELYMGITHGDLSIKSVEAVLRRLLCPAPTVLRRPKKPVATQSSVTVLGETNIQTGSARCCNPIPGDPIIGYISVGRGVIVHRNDCVSIANLSAADRVRLVEVEWSHQASISRAILMIQAFDRIGILEDIVHAISSSRTNISEIKTKTIKSGGKMRAVVAIDVMDTIHLNRVKESLLQVTDVLSVQRLLK